MIKHYETTTDKCEKCNKTLKLPEVIPNVHTSFVRQVRGEERKKTCNYKICESDFFFWCFGLCIYESKMLIPNEYVSTAEDIADQV